MSFDDWLRMYDENYAKHFSRKPDYSDSQLYFMRAAYRAGMERAAEIAQATEIDCVLDAHFVIAEAIRKELDNE